VSGGVPGEPGRQTVLATFCPEKEAVRGPNLSYYVGENFRWHLVRLCSLSKVGDQPIGGSRVQKFGGTGPSRLRSPWLLSAPTNLFLALQ